MVSIHSTIKKVGSFTCFSPQPTEGHAATALLHYTNLLEQFALKMNSNRNPGFCDKTKQDIFDNITRKITETDDMYGKVSITHC